MIERPEMWARIVQRMAFNFCAIWPEGELEAPATQEQVDVMVDLVRACIAYDRSVMEAHAADVPLPEMGQPEYRGAFRWPRWWRR